MHQCALTVFVLRVNIYAALQQFKAKITKRAAAAAIDAVIESIEEGLAKGEKIQLIGFGTFEVHARKARTGRNPQSGGAIEIPATNHPFFSAGKALKDAVNVGK